MDNCKDCNISSIGEYWVSMCVCTCKKKIGVMRGIVVDVPDGYYPHELIALKEKDSDLYSYISPEYVLKDEDFFLEKDDAIKREERAILEGISDGAFQNDVLKGKSIEDIFNENFPKYEKYKVFK